MQINTAEAGRGAAWLLEGFDYFKRDPVTWIGLMAVALVINLLFNVIPFLGTLASCILGTIFAAGMILGCKAIDSGDELKISHLFAGFSADVAQLAVLGVIFTVSMAVLFIIALLGVWLIGFNVGQFTTAMESGDATNVAVDSGAIFIPFLVALGLSVPLMMAYWFAPALIVLKKVNAIQALKQSFTASLVNIAPFVVYGLVGLAVIVGVYVAVLILAMVLGAITTPYIALLLVPLPWLVLGPTVIASIYISYVDIFGVEPATTA